MLTFLLQKETLTLDCELYLCNLLQDKMLIFCFTITFRIFVLTFPSFLCKNQIFVFLLKQRLHLSCIGTPNPASFNKLCHLGALVLPRRTVGFLKLNVAYEF